jgi:hypothetical protein
MLILITFFDYFLHIQSNCFNFADANQPHRGEAEVERGLSVVTPVTFL